MGDDQTDVIRFLMHPGTHDGIEPEHVETHGAHVFLAGGTALKIKRATKYEYMDLSTLDLREKMLQRELELNQPVAPSIYCDVVSITREHSGLAINGSGPVVEWVLRMHRFPKENELLEVAARGDLDANMAEELGRAVAVFHAAAPTRLEDGAKLIGAILDELDLAFGQMHGELGKEEITHFHDLSRAELEKTGPLLTQRGSDGHVRRCHGDLHLRNFVLIDGKPVPFDALEFDEVLGTCDVLYDLAFLLMDLKYRGHNLAANQTLSTWLFVQDGKEDAGVAALPLFIAVRAAIRAMVDVQTDRATDHPGQSGEDACAYLDEAIVALSPPAPRIVAVGGLSGSGKTILSRKLAATIGAQSGAIHLRTDLERKRLAGVDPLAHLSNDAYSGSKTQTVYDVLLRRAGTLLGAGHSVLLDATWLSPDLRAAVEELGRQAGVPFTGLWLDAPSEVLLARIADRMGDASDADASVVGRQIARDIGQVTWERIDATGTPDDTQSRATAVLKG
ncbi:bifunctional aminoglycoside phosphotransferase/ATP-binding protein [Pseudoruegeria sp. HB172150]|uniref:bifunctional aminoglycoside phosphotransferase/ATP-binding protein n=1 Tax=Pseudoruegeria sp. HB172150 TaxID=2721164 RepID=UPI001555E893|nr:bifunctional aminoglycoside phosphotransferase/ATP-binding protein [Pseudoruegeria sp. HB172150]